MASKESEKTDRLEPESVKDKQLGKMEYLDQELCPANVCRVLNQVQSKAVLSE